MAKVVEIKGLKELNKLLQKLPVEVETKAMRGAMLSGQRVIANAAKENLDAAGAFKTGELKKSIRVRFKKKSQVYGWLRYEVVAGNRKAWYSHLLEYGSASYYTGHGKSVGKPYQIKPSNRKALKIGDEFKAGAMHPGVKPIPFMRSAFDSKAQEAIDTTAKFLRKRIPKLIKKV